MTIISLIFLLLTTSPTQSNWVDDTESGLGAVPTAVEIQELDLELKAWRIANGLEK